MRRPSCAPPSCCDEEGGDREVGEVWRGGQPRPQPSRSAMTTREHNEPPPPPARA